MHLILQFVNEMAKRQKSKTNTGSYVEILYILRFNKLSTNNIIKTSILGINYLNPNYKAQKPSKRTFTERAAVL